MTKHYHELEGPSETLSVHPPHLAPSPYHDFDDGVDMFAMLIENGQVICWSSFEGLADSRLSHKRTWDWHIRGLFHIGRWFFQGGHLKSSARGQSDATRVTGWREVLRCHHCPDPPKYARVRYRNGDPRDLTPVNLEVLMTKDT